MSKMPTGQYKTLLSRKAHAAVIYARAEAQVSQNELVSTGHLLYALILVDERLGKLVKSRGITTERIHSILEGMLKRNPSQLFGTRPKRSDHLFNVMLAAWRRAKERADDRIYLSDLLVALVEGEPSTAHRMIEKLGLTTEALFTALTVKSKDA